MTDSVSPFDKQIANRNYMSPLGFKLVLTKTPKVDFLCQSANIPSISMGTAIQPSYLKDIPVPGDKVLYDDLTVRFLVDEKMENYLAIYKWITGLGYPESLGQFEQLRKDDNRTRRLHDSIAREETFFTSANGSTSRVSDPISKAIADHRRRRRGRSACNFDCEQIARRLENRCC